MSKKIYNKYICYIISIIFLTLTVSSCASNNTGVVYEEVAYTNEDTDDNSEDSNNHSELNYDSEESENSQEAFVYVQLCGAVASPGVYKVDSSLRVFEVLELAGGVISEADTDVVNLARPVSDEMRIYIPTKEETASGQYSAAYIEEIALPDNQSAVYDNHDHQDNNSNTQYSETFSSDRQQNGLVNINTADKEALMTLTGIGESRALAIISYREDNGRFNSIEDIMKVTGIKQAAFDKIKDKITV